MSKLEISVDVIGQLKLLKRGLFQNPYAFIEEAIQNAERAKATFINFTVEQHKLIVEDDGIGLSDPSDLFMMAKSGWDAETTANENPFGLGFFSCVAMADNIRVESKGKAYIFNITKMIETGDVSIIEEAIPEKPGFTVILTDLGENVNIWSARNKIREIGECILAIEVRLDGFAVPRVDYLKPKGEYVTDIKEHGIKGWIAIAEYAWDAKVVIYNHGRKVMDLPDMSGINGALDVEASIVDLKAPDRKDIVRNERYDAFMARVKENVRKILLKP
jgi:hypothetical protein